MVEIQYWDFDLWREARDYEISLLDSGYQQFYKEREATYLQKQVMAAREVVK